LGVLIEKKLAIGTLLVRTITNRNANDLADRLQSGGYGVTTIAAQGATGPVKIVFTVIKRKELANGVGLIQEVDPKAFYSVDEIQMAAAGVFPGGTVHPRRGLFRLLRVSVPRGVGMPPCTEDLQGATGRAA